MFSVPNLKHFGYNPGSAEPTSSVLAWLESSSLVSVDLWSAEIEAVIPPAVVNNVSSIRSECRYVVQGLQQVSHFPNVTAAYLYADTTDGTGPVHPMALPVLESLTLSLLAEDPDNPDSDESGDEEEDDSTATLSKWLPGHRARMLQQSLVITVKQWCKSTTDF
jgi:hypothetical protein